MYTRRTAAQSSKSFTSFSSPFHTLWAYEKDFIFHKEAGQFYVLNFQGTVYIRNGITYSLPLIGGSILIINQHLSRRFISIQKPDPSHWSILIEVRLRLQNANMHRE